MADFMRDYPPRRSGRWDIQVNAGIMENSIEYSHAKGVVIRSNSIDVAMGLVVRGRELMEKYPDNTCYGPECGPAEF